MDKEEIEAIEVKPKEEGRYLVTLFKREKGVVDSEGYIEAMADFDGHEWDYAEYKSLYYVCVIHHKETGKSK